MKKKNIFTGNYDPLTEEDYSCLTEIKVTPENFDEVIRKVKENPGNYKVTISLTPLGESLVEAIRRLDL